MTALAADIGAALPLAVTLDFLQSPGFWVGVLVIAGTYALVALGLQINVGYTGIVNFGQAGFMAIGAYAMAILVLETDISFWLSLPIAIACAIAFGLLVGLPSLRLRADYFAIATLAMAEMVRLFAQNARELTGGNQGLFCNNETGECYDEAWLNVSDTIAGWFEGWGRFFEDSLFPLLLVVWATVIIATVALIFIQRTPWGRVLRAVREDEDAVRALGKNPLVFKLQSLAIAASLAAIAGVFLALNLGAVHPVGFEPLVTFFAFAVLILGGLTSYWGVLFGSILFWTVLEGTRFIEIFEQETDQAALRLAITGMVLILLMAFRPQGAVRQARGDGPR